MLKFKKGYLCYIRTWENDGDLYQTQQFHCDNLETAKQLKLFLKTYMSSGSGFDHNGVHHRSYGNAGNNDAHLLDELWHEYNFQCLIGDMEDFLHRYIGQIEYWDNDCGWRVFENMHIYHIPEDIAFEEIQ